MNKIERVFAVLEGRRPDRPPVSFWHHFPLDCAAGPAAVEAHVRHVERYDLDFLKVMDDNRYPRLGLPDGMVSQAADLDGLTVLQGDEDSFGRQLELIRELSQRYAGRLLMITTIFNAWTTLRLLMAPPAGKHGPPKLGGDVDPRDEQMWRLLRESPDALARALDTIATSLANFCGRCIEAGADGIFLSVRDDWVDTPANGPGNYDRFVRPTDLKILAGVQRGAFNMLHVCGQAVNFGRFAEYPVHAVNWADRYAGPPLAAVAATHAAGHLRRAGQFGHAGLGDAGGLSARGRGCHPASGPAAADRRSRLYVRPGYRASRQSGCRPASCRKGLDGLKTRNPGERWASAHRCIVSATTFSTVC